MKNNMKNNILLNKFLLYNSEGLAYGITEMFSRNLAELLSDKIMIVYPDFDRDSFIQSIENHVVGKTYTRRIPIFRLTVERASSGRLREGFVRFDRYLGRRKSQRNGNV